jgi:hypothetical protein
VAADTWLAAWHALVSRFLVIIHYEMTVDVLFSCVPFLVISPYHIRQKVVEFPSEVAVDGN